VRDAIHLLTPRAVNQDVADALIREMDWYDRYLQTGEATAAPTHARQQEGRPLQHRRKGDGLGDQVRHQPDLRGAVARERVRDKGLIFAATPASDFICGTLQLASGMTLHVFTTGRGTPYGLAAAPVIKVSTRSDLSQRWHDLIDVDAGTIATGKATIETWAGRSSTSSWSRLRPPEDLVRQMGNSQFSGAVQPGAGDLTPVWKEVARAIADMGAKRCFGLVGGANFKVTHALTELGVEFVAARHEGGAVTMATWPRDRAAIS